MKKINSSPLFFLTIAFVLLVFSDSVVTARTLENIKKNGVIRIATRDDVPPIQFKNSDGQLVGIDPDIGKMIADALGVKPEWEILKSPKFRSDVILEKKVDLVISSFSVTKERLAVINFSVPYYTTGLAIMVRSSDADKIKTYKDLSGKRVTTTKGSTGEKALAELIPDASIAYANDTPSTYENLIKKSADAVVNDRIFLEYYASGKPELHVVDGTITADQYGIGMNKEDTELLEFVNSFLSEIKKNGKLDSVIKKYLGVAVSSEVAETKKESITTYIVQANDSLSKIAVKFYGDATKWNVIFSSNADTIKFVNALEVGWKLRIPELDHGSSDNKEK